MIDSLKVVTENPLPACILNGKVTIKILALLLIKISVAPQFHEIYLFTRKFRKSYICLYQCMHVCFLHNYFRFSLTEICVCIICLFFCIYYYAYKFLFYMAFMVFPSCATFLQLQAFSLYDGVSCSRRLLCFQLSSGFKLHFISVLVHSAVFVFCCRRCW